MAVRFVIGRAGTGKTHHCVQAVQDGLRQDPIDGPQLILLVPEQAALQMERAILAPADIPVAHRAQALSFRRLAFKILEGSNPTSRKALSEPARAMILRYLLQRHATDLHYYRRTVLFGGFVHGLSTTIAELMQEDVPPSDLQDAAQSCRNRADQQAKLHDIGLIYQSYLDYLGDERLDPTQHLQVAREQIPDCLWLRGARVWVDGFASLSGLETLILIDLARMCESLEITLMMDPARIESPQSRSARFHMFRRSSRTFADLERHFREAAIACEEPLLLRPDTPPRFKRCPDLALLERSIFSAIGEPQATVEGERTRIEIAALPSRRWEARYAASKICQWTQREEEPLRYRDIAVIVRDLEPYHDLLSATLSSAGIPFFIDRRRPIAHHPLIELLRAATLMVADDLSLESVRLVLKTGLLPLSNEAADELENYLLAHGIAGRNAWLGNPWTMQTTDGLRNAAEKKTDAEAEMCRRVNAARLAFLSAWDGWLKFVDTSNAPLGAQWAQAVRELLKNLDVGTSLHAWADEATLDGDTDQAEEHSQVYVDVLEFLDDMSDAFADLVLSVDEIGRVLDAGLSGLTLGLAPPMVDQVLVGSIERSRHPDIRAAVILGFNDGVFPHPIGESAVLNDDDREFLIDSGLRVGTPAAERTLEENAFAYLALTRASEACVVTYAAADEDGKRLFPSPYISEIRRVLPALEAKTIPDPWRTRDTWDIVSARDLVARVAMEFRNRPSCRQDDTAKRKLWNALYNAAQSCGRSDTVLRGTLSGLQAEPARGLAPATTETLYQGKLRTSVSELETYAACPFQHFAKYTLRLRERLHCSLEAVDVGSIHHAVLEDVIATLAQQRGLGDTDETTLLSILDASCRRVSLMLPSTGVLSDARNAYVMRRTASQLARILSNQRRLACGSRMQIGGAEIPFGALDGRGLPALTIHTPNGRQVFLRGFIDRVDLAELGDELLGVVIDYKRTRDKRLDMDRVYYGLSLQLVAYLLALAECGETLAGRPIRPAAALYVSLASRYLSVDHPDEPRSARDEDLEGTFRPRGIIALDGLGALDPNVTSGRSELYNVYIKKDGTLGNVDSTDAVDPDTMSAVFTHTRRKLGELADGLLDGKIAAIPYRLGTLSPCSWCPMASVCRFEMGLCEARFLDTLKRSEVFDKLTNAHSGDSGGSDGSP